MVAGLGNTEITPDNLGPKTAKGVLATRHITGELARSTGLDDLRPVAVLAPGVLGQTGIETGELLYSVTQKLRPAALIVVDAWPPEGWIVWAVPSRYRIQGSAGIRGGKRQA